MAAEDAAESLECQVALRGALQARRESQLGAFVKVEVEFHKNVFSILPRRVNDEHHGGRHMARLRNLAL